MLNFDSERPASGGESPSQQNLVRPAVSRGGRTEEAKRIRQSVYCEPVIAGFPPHECSEQTFSWKRPSGVGDFARFEAESTPKPIGIATFAEPWSVTTVEAALAAAAARAKQAAAEGQAADAPLIASIAAPSANEGPKANARARAAAVAAGAPSRRGGAGMDASQAPLAPPTLSACPVLAALQCNCADEGQRSATAPLWWRDSARLSYDDTNDVAPDIFMDVAYPSQGFYVRRDGDTRFEWNQRFQAAFNLGETPERRERLADFVRAFCAEAVPLAVEVLSNLGALPSPVVHCGGVTIEVCGLQPTAKWMFGDETLRAHKLASREFHARAMAQAAAVPQLVVPFTILVELLGARALAYPRIPVDGGGAGPVSGSADVSGDAAADSAAGAAPLPSELVYGLPALERFHLEDIRQRDSEVNSIAQRMCSTGAVKSKGHWMGREFSARRFVFGPVDARFFRSRVDNRIYAVNLARLPASTTLAHVAGYGEDDPLAPLAAPNDYALELLRPEFVRHHQTTELSSDAASPLCRINRDRDEAERVANVRTLREYLLPQAAEQLSRDCRLNGVTWPFFERGGLSHFLHSWGINMRYLPLVQQKLLRTKNSGSALEVVEVELAARALKAWVLAAARNKVSGCVVVADAAAALRSLLPPFSPEVFDVVVWSAVAKRYPLLAQGSRWDVRRVAHECVLSRLLRLLGATVATAADGALAPAAIARLSADAIASAKIAFGPRVRCPPYPRAPLEEGQDVHLMCVAKRYLREVAVDLKIKPITDRDMVARYISFLAMIGERACEEIEGFYAAEQERKDRVLRGAKPVVVAETVSDKMIKYRLKNGRGMRVFDVSREALETFRFAHGQRVQATLGAESGMLATIVGVLDGALYKHDDGDDGATEVIGRDHAEVQANYGFVVLDRLLVVRRLAAAAAAAAAASAANSPKGGRHTPAARRRRTVTVNAPGGGAGGSSPAAGTNMSAADAAANEGPVILEPFHLAGERALRIFEAARQPLVAAFGVAHGDRLLFLRGPRAGRVTTVLGTIDGHLWHHDDYELAPEVVRHPAVPATHGAGGRAFAPEDYVVVAHEAPVSYPIEARRTFDAGLQIFAGYRSCVQYGFHYRQLLLLTAGPHAGEEGVVLGVAAGFLTILLRHRPLPVSIGRIYAETVEAHAPRYLGLLAYDPLPPAALPRTTLVYPGLGGSEPLRFDAACSACMPFGAVCGQRVKVVLGFNSGACGIVVGVRKERLWVQFADAGPGEMARAAQPVVAEHLVVLHGSIYDPDPIFDCAPRRKTNAALPFMFLTFFGEVALFDAAPAACQPFGYYHGQILEVEADPIFRAADGTLVGGGRGSERMTVVVVGELLGELWYVRDGEPFARPFAPRGRWALDCALRPEVRGLRPLLQWGDMFLPSGASLRVALRRFCGSKHDEHTVVPHIATWPTSDGRFVGLDTRPAAVRAVWAAFAPNRTIIRQDRIVTEVSEEGCVVHRPDGPQAVVVGAFDGVLFVRLRRSPSEAASGVLATAPSESATAAAYDDSELALVVVALPPGEVPRWLVCADWRLQLARPFVDPVDVGKRTLAERIALRQASSASRFKWWGYVDDDGEFVHFDTRTTLQLSRLRANPRQGLTFYDADGGAFSLETMTVRYRKPEDDSDASGAARAAMVQAALTRRRSVVALRKQRSEAAVMASASPMLSVSSGFEPRRAASVSSAASSDDEDDGTVTFPLRCEEVETLGSYCLFAHRVDVEAALPDVAKALLHRVASRFQSLLGSGRALRTVVESRAIHTIFAPGREQEILHDVCRVVPEIVAHHVERLAASDDGRRAREVELRYQAVPAPLRVPVLRWVLALCGVGAAAAVRSGKRGDDVEAQLFALVAAAEQLHGRALDAPTMAEFLLGIEDQLAECAGLEATRRAALEQEQLMRLRRLLPVSSSLFDNRGDAFAAGAPQSLAPQPSGLVKSGTIIVPAAAAQTPQPAPQSLASAPRVRSVLPAASLVSSRRPTAQPHRFVLEDTTVIRFEPSCMAFVRGDVVEYGHGDVAGTRATILGMYDGRLWRCEHAPSALANIALPFAGDEEQIMERYQLRVVGTAGDAARLLAHNALRVTTFDGAVAELDTSFDTVRAFGVAAGDRLYRSVAGTRAVVDDTAANAAMPLAGPRAERRYGTFGDDSHAENEPLPFPYAGTMIVVLGVWKERLWFAVDQTGALPFPRTDAPVDVTVTYGLRRVTSGPVRVPAPTRGRAANLASGLGILPAGECDFLLTGGAQALLFNVAPAVLADFGVEQMPLRVAFLDGEWKGKRATVVGVRHARLWLQLENEPAARPLPRGGTLRDVAHRVLPLDRHALALAAEATASAVAALTPPPGAGAGVASSGAASADASDEPLFRFPTQRGGIGLFNAGPVVQLRFGLAAGQRFEYAPKAKGPAHPKKRAVIVGLRQGVLWRLDDGMSDARPFIGVPDRQTLLGKYFVVPGEEGQLPSHTW